MADAVPRGMDKDKVVAQARRAFAGSLANDTKWNALIAHVRALEDGRPSFRSKWVSGHISEWDVEWFHHLPFPFVGVAWLDLGLRVNRRQPVRRGAEIVDCSESITRLLAGIGFEFEVRGDVARIWGYAPKCYADFPPAA